MLALPVLCGRTWPRALADAPVAAAPARSYRRRAGRRSKRSGMDLQHPSAPKRVPHHHGL